MAQHVHDLLVLSQRDTTYRWLVSRDSHDLRAL
jgi:hypothetical protein